MGGHWFSHTMVVRAGLQVEKMVLAEVSPGLNDTFGVKNTSTDYTPFKSALNHCPSTTLHYKFEDAVDLNGGRSLCPAHQWVDPPPLIAELMGEVIVGAEERTDADLLDMVNPRANNSQAEAGGGGRKRARGAR